ncbi:MAG: beta-ketoacyl synthase N-terminal-like domain-containing protein [Phycisphaerales bacterium]
MSRRVVITGLGPITAFGVGMAPLWSALCEGRSAVKRIARFDPSGFACTVAAEVPDGLFDVRNVVPKSYRKATKVMARDIELAVGGAAAAIADARLVTRAAEAVAGGTAAPTIAPERFGCHIGAGLIAAETDELTAALATARASDGSFDYGMWGGQSPGAAGAQPGGGGMNNLTPLWLLKYLPNMLACHVTIIHDCQGPSNTITCAEASGALSMGESLRVIQRGDADACLSGGAETKVHLMGMLRQQFSKRLVGSADDGAAGPVDDAAQVAAVRPFDPGSRGTVLGEGGGIVVLEAHEVATARGASIAAEIAGFGASQNLNPDTVGLRGEPDGDALACAIEAALAGARIAATQIDAIVPLGSGIVDSDANEAAALRRVFGARLPSIPLVTLVPAVGNCCAGAGGVAVAVAAMCLREQMLPARLNSAATPGVDATATPARRAELRHILVCTTSFGGQNAALVVRHSGN